MGVITVPGRGRTVADAQRDARWLADMMHPGIPMESRISQVWRSEGQWAGEFSFRVREPCDRPPGRR